MDFSVKRFALKKILIIRFSSIGDIVLTTPVVRCLKKQLPNVEVHYLTKKSFFPVIEHNPHIDKIHCLQDNLNATIEDLKAEEFDFIIDLHKNIRSKRVIRALKTKYSAFPKLNLKKWWFVRTKRNCMPNIHIVDRYFEAAKALGIKNDNLGLDYFTGIQEEISNLLPSNFEKYIAIVCGGAHATKQIPNEKIDYLCSAIDSKILLIGGKSDAEAVRFLEEKYPEKVFNACGKFSLNQSAFLIEHAQLVITPDTGMMHIASAFKKKVFSVWGNTVPEFGMYPYIPQKKENVFIFEVKGLPCRPCSKIGYDKCPKKHFNCMNKNHWEQIVEQTKIIRQD